jgi:hypothetical protein
MLNVGAITIRRWNHLFLLTHIPVPIPLFIQAGEWTVRGGKSGGVGRRGERHQTPQTFDEIVSQPVRRFGVVQRAAIGPIQLKLSPKNPGSDRKQVAAATVEIGFSTLSSLAGVGENEPNVAAAHGFSSFFSGEIFADSMMLPEPHSNA